MSIVELRDHCRLGYDWREWWQLLLTLAYRPNSPLYTHWLQTALNMHHLIASSREGVTLGICKTWRLYVMHTVAGEVASIINALHIGEYRKSFITNRSSSVSNSTPFAYINILRYCIHFQWSCHFLSSSSMSSSSIASSSFSSLSSTFLLLAAFYHSDYQNIEHELIFTKCSWVSYKKLYRVKNSLVPHVNRWIQCEAFASITSFDSPTLSYMYVHVIATCKAKDMQMTDKNAPAQSCTNKANVCKGM